MRLHRKLVGAFIALSLLPLLATAVLAHDAATDQLEDQILDQLEGFAEVQTERLEASVDRNLERVALVASRTQLRLSLENFTETQDPDQRDRMHAILDDARTSTDGIRTIEVATMEGVVVASTNRSTIDEDRSQAPSFIDGRQRAVGDRVVRQGPDQIALELSAPLVLDGRTIGVAMVEATADSLLEIVMDRTGLGETGETLVAEPGPDGGALFLTPLRHLEETPSRIQVPADATDVAITRALAGEDVVMTDGIDYRGEPVLAATGKLSNAPWGVVVKMDKAEAFAPISGLTQKLVGIGVIVGAAVFGVSWWAARAIARPVAERDRAVAERSRFFKLSNELLCIATLDGWFEEINPAWEATLGWSREQLSAQPYVEFVHPEDREATIEAASALTESEDVVSFENRYQTKDGGWRWLRWNAVADLDLDRVYAVAHDTTELRQAHQALQAYTRRLKASNEDLEQFASIASHDLQEPLRSVAGFAQLLKTDYEGQLDEEADHFIDRILAATERMRGLIDDLLAYSRVTRKGAAFQSTNLEDPLGEVLANLDAAISRTDAQVTVDDSLPTVPADRHQMVQLLQNVIGNALKYRKQDTPPRIQLSVRPWAGPRREDGPAEDDGEDAWGWCFAVADNGIGIEPDHQEKVLEIFQRLHRDEAIEGTGLGLALCKRIVERHGGNIWITSEGSGEGTTVHFTLSATQALDDVSAPGQAGEHKRGEPTDDQPME